MDCINNILKSLVEFIKGIISLCNDNSGFVSAILAIITAIISIKIGRLPYNKKLVFYHALDSNTIDDIVIDLYVSNVGSCPVYVDKLFAKEGFIKVIGCCKEVESTMLEDRLIKPQETQYYKIHLKRYKYWSSLKRKHLRIILKSGNKTFRYRTNWIMG